MTERLDTPSPGLAHRVPRRRADLEEFQVSEEGGPGCILHDPVQGVDIELAPPEATVWNLAGQGLDMKGILRAAMAHRPPLSPGRVGEALETLSREGLLVDTSPAPPPEGLLVSLGGIEAPEAGESGLQSFVFFFLLVLPLLGLVFLVRDVLGQGLLFFPEGTSAVTMVLCLSAALSFRNLVRGLLSLSVSIDVQAWGLGHRFGLPVLDVLTESAPAPDAIGAWGGLGSWLALAGLASLGTQVHPPLPFLPAPVLEQLSAVALLCFLLDLSPFLDGSGARLIALGSGLGDLRHRAMTLVTERSASLLIEGRPLRPSERPPGLFVLASVIWTLAALQSGAALAAEAAPTLLASSLMGSSVLSLSLSALFLAAVLGGVTWATLLTAAAPLSLLGHLLAARGTSSVLLLLASLGAAISSMGPSGGSLPFVHLGCMGLAVFGLRSSRNLLAGTPGGWAWRLLEMGLIVRLAAEIPLCLGRAGWLLPSSLPLALLQGVGLGTQGLAMLAASLLLFAWWRRDLQRGVRSLVVVTLIALGYVLHVRMLLAPAPSFALAVAFGLDVAGRGALCVTAVGLLLSRKGSQVSVFWRLTFTGLTMFLAAVLCGGSPAIDLVRGLSTEALRFEVAAFVFIASTLATTRLPGAADTGLPAPGRVLRNSPWGGDPARVSLELLQRLVRIAREEIARNQGLQVRDVFDRRFDSMLTSRLRGEVFLADEDLCVPAWDDQDPEWATRVLRGTFRALEEEFIREAGRERFRDVLERLSAESALADWKVFQQTALSERWSVVGPQASPEQILESPLLRRLDTSAAEALVATVRGLHVPAGSIPGFGTPPEEAMVYLIDGVLEASPPSLPNGDEGARERKVLHPGDTVGELAITEQPSEPYRLRALSDAEILVVTRNDLEGLGEAGQEVRAHVSRVLEVVALLERIPGLAALPRRVLLSLGAAATETRLPRQGVLETGAAPLDCLVAVKKGRLAIFETLGGASPASAEGGEDLSPTAVLAAGDAYGLESELASAPEMIGTLQGRTVSLRIVAEDDTDLLKIPFSCLDEALERLLEGCHSAADLRMRCSPPGL